MFTGLWLLDAREEVRASPWLAICSDRSMANSAPLTRYATRKLTRRLSRSLPWVGGVIALATIGSAMRRKGIVRGIIHSALDAIPYVGAAKNMTEAVRGRDFLADKVSVP